MADFLTGKELNNTIGHLFEAAKAQIIIISPYIKLHSGYKELLAPHRNNHKVELTVVFGKNDQDLTKSMGAESFKFFREFSNVEIRHEPRLHAKYYANENFSILTSMNLYSFSQDNNIEAGIITKASKFRNVAHAVFDGAGTLDKKAWKFVAQVILNSKIMYQRFPKYDKKFFNLKKKYAHSFVNLDLLSEIYGLRSLPKYGENSQENVTENVSKQGQRMGYCIRTKIPIPFDPARPFCNEAFMEWAKFKNPNYPENFCHFSGDFSNGKTSLLKPILPTHWSKAKNLIDS
jgi:hypothetical protein